MRNIRRRSSLELDAMPLIDVGSTAPDFSLPDQHGVTRRLSDFRGKTVVLYFYPEDDTPSCTDEACAFRDALPDFATTGAVVLGISPDSVESHRSFAAAHALTFTLLADPPSSQGAPPPTCDAYGVWQQKTMYGRSYMGIVRTTYLIGPDLRVVHRWDRVRVKGHAEAVLEKVLGGGDENRSAAKPQSSTPRAKGPKPKNAKKKTSKKPAATRPSTKSGARKSPRAKRGS